MEQIRISVKEVKALLESGVTKEEVKKRLYPTLADASWKRALKDMGLSQFRVKVKSYIIEDIEGTEEIKDAVTPQGSNYAPSSSESEESPFNV